VLSYFQAIVLGVVQGVSELFPVSSLGHSVLLPALFGWTNLVNAQSSRHNSFFLAFVVALHVATALALLAFFWRDWVRIITALWSSLRYRRIQSADERLAWLLVVATVPAALTGLLFEHSLRVLFAKPLAAAIFLVVNGLILLVGDRAAVVSRRRRRTVERHKTREAAPFEAGEKGRSKELASLAFGEAGIIGVAQMFALLAGISRSGITMTAGLLRGLDHEDAARFSFLLATPVILLAGIYEIPLLLGPVGDGVRYQALAGGVAAFVAALLSVRYLMRYFTSHRLWPFAGYSLVFGLAMVVRFGIF
jgi:undecaprenyl-diphosphatase